MKSCDVCYACRHYYICNAEWLKKYILTRLFFKCFIQFTTWKKLKLHFLSTNTLKIANKIILPIFQPYCIYATHGWVICQQPTVKLVKWNKSNHSLKQKFINKYLTSSHFLWYCDRIVNPLKLQFIRFVIMSSFPGRK